MPGKQGYVLPPVAKRGNIQHYGADPEIEIVAKRLLGDLFPQAPVRCRKNPDVHEDGFVSPDPLDLLLFQGAQEFRLQRQRQFPDLVEEQGAPMGDLERPAALCRGSGERPFLMAEQFALDQFRRDRPAIHYDERVVPAPGAVVDPPRNQLFPAPGFAFDEDREVGISNAANVINKSYNNRRLSHKTERRR